MDAIGLEKAKKIFAEEAKDMGLDLISVKAKQSKDGEILEVFIDKDYAIDMKTIEEYTDRVSPKLDEIVELKDPYFLDISSGGSEREIPYGDVKKLIGHYLEVKVKKSGETLLAKATSVDEENKLHLFYFIKGRKKQVVLSSDEIESIHMGYKA